MGDNTGISWTDATWNPVIGCRRVSPGCENCYAERQAVRLGNMGQQDYEGLTNGDLKKPRWSGIARFLPGRLDQPIRWKRPGKIFVNSMSDLFHSDVSFEEIAAIFGVAAMAPQHIFQLLTKRHVRMEEFFLWAAGDGRREGDTIVDDCIMRALEQLHWVDDAPAGEYEQADWPLPNVWLGVSVEDQARANFRIPYLLMCPARVHWLSCEPLLGAVDIQEAYESGNYELYNGNQIEWVVVGGESGPGARPMHPEWAEHLRDQCLGFEIPSHFKQWGNWSTIYRCEDDPDFRNPPEVNNHTKRRWLNYEGGYGFHGHAVVAVENVGKKKAGRVLDGLTWDEWPA